MLCIVLHIILNDALVLSSYLMLIVHILECITQLHDDDDVVVKHSTAGTLCWGVI